jgi:hypothetical protein
MEDNNWHKGIEKEIGSLKEKMKKGDYQLYEVESLLRVAKIVNTLSSDCEDCQGHRNDISNLVANLGNLPMTNEDVSDYGGTFRNIIKHLKKHHGLPMAVYYKPKTALGKWSIGFFVGTIVFYLLSSQLPAFYFLGITSGIFAFFTGIISIIISKERSVIVFIATSVAFLHLGFFILAILYTLS